MSVLIKNNQIGKGSTINLDKLVDDDGVNFGERWSADALSLSDDGGAPIMGISDYIGAADLLGDSASETPVAAQPIPQAAALGDVAIVGFSADAVTGGKGLALVVLTTVSSPETIVITDNGWTAAGAFRSGEGTYTFTIPTGLPAGTVIYISNLNATPVITASNGTALTGTKSGSIDPSGSGDAFLVYQGSAASPTFLFAVDFADGNTTYSGDATNTNTSAVPPGLTYGVNALGFGLDNGAYTGPLSGSRSEILANIANPANWTTNDTTLPAYPGSFTITAGGVPSLSINDVTQSEGNAGTVIFTFTVSLSSAAPAGGVTFDISTADGTASAPGDYASHVLTSQTIPAGSNSYTFDVTVNGDTAIEPNETFFVNVTNVTGATVADGQGQGTITNDDTPPVGSLTIGDVTMVEGNSGVTNFVFTVARSNGSTGAVGVTWTLNNVSTNAADFDTSTFTGTISFADGETSKTIIIPVLGDTTIEGNETFTVTLSNPTGGVTITDGSGLGTITNDDFGPIANVWVNEINYDPAGNDAGEFIEIAGVAGTDLTGWSLVLYNGNGGAVYSTTNLSGILANTNGGFGFVKIAYAANGIQNGAPDGIALIDNAGRVLQFISYEGTMVAVGGPAGGMTSTDIGVLQENAPVGFTLQLQGAGSSYADFTWGANVANTEGAINDSQSFLSATDPGQIRILDASIAEGNSGTTLLTFIVRRAGGSALASDVGYTIHLDGTADLADLAPSAVLSGTVSFGVGEFQKTITVAIQGDTVGEFNETLSVTLDSATNATIVDNSATGTIINDDPLSLRIFQIQGKGHMSAYNGQNITTTGIVTAVDTDGFYVQDATGDNRDWTSDAIFVATGTAPTVAVGDAISVTGIVAEVRPGNNPTNLTVTQITSPLVDISSHGNTLPAAVLIGVGGRMAPTDIFDDDQFTYTDFDEASDFYESLEGMRVTIDAPLVTSATNEFGETFVVASGGVGATGLNSRGGMTISGNAVGYDTGNADGYDDYNPERIQLDDDSGLFAGFAPNYTQGDRLSNVTGIMSYNFNYYELLVTEAVTITTDAGALPRETTALQGNADRISIAAYNVENLDPGDAKFNLLANDIVVNLRAPDVISLEEIQDADGAGNGTDLSGTVTAQKLIDAIVTAGGPTYTYIEVAPSAAGTTGGEPGGNIRNGFLYRTDRVSYVTGSATAVPGAAFSGSRSPLSAQFSFNGEVITAISVHSTSRGGSDPLFGSTQLPANAGEGSRDAQSQAIKAYVTSLLSTNPDAYVAVMGDFNAFWFENSLELLENGVMTNLHRLLAEEERYTYVFEGNAQAIDHILVTNNLVANAQFDAVHLNSEQPDTPSRPTDHDPVITTLLLNSSAIAQASSASGDEDTQIAGTVTAIDKNGDTLTYALVTGAANGTVVVNSDGTYTYTPNANFNGTDSFTFRANDGFNNGPAATVTLTVNPVNDAPTDITLTGNSVAENAANGTVVGTAAASDPDGTAGIRYRMVDPAEGRFQIDENTGVITVANGSLLDYESNTSHEIWIRVWDPANGTIKRMFVINVTDVAESGAMVAPSTEDLLDGGVAASDMVDLSALVGTDSADQGLAWAPTYANSPLLAKFDDAFLAARMPQLAIDTTSYLP